jgi:hypothetical protein
MMGAPQGTQEWRIERAGHATASCFAKVLAKIKSGEAAERRRYRTQLVVERLTGVPVDGYTNAAIQWGIDHEAEARAAYSAHTGELVEQQPFTKHPTLAWCGCSPDGFVGDAGMVQFKCPETATHIGYLLAGVLPTDYVAQVQGELWVAGREWSDFVSFDPRLPANLRMFVVRVPRDDEYIVKVLAPEVERFLDEVDRDHRRLMERAA